MHTPTRRRRFRAWSLLTVPLLAFTTAPLFPQGTCSCGSTRPFASCVVDFINDANPLGGYPDQFPGSVAIVPVDAKEMVAYVVDYFSGRTHRFEIDPTLGRLGLADEIFSPLGSRVTTGMAHRMTTEGSFLYWAIEGKIVRTDLEGEGAVELGTVQLQDLAVFLRLDFPTGTFPVGSLGGITYHRARDTFWGVDIVNDVYFEFRESGDLVFENAKPVYFLNPERNELTGGAYGNSITYLTAGGQDFFDIPVGSLADGRPSKVVRVHASPQTPPQGNRKIGDDTGIFYPLAAAAGSPRFVTGIAFWQDFCAVGQHVELLLETNFQGSDRAQIILVSADDPTAASIADFQCTKAPPSSVTLAWRKTTPYTQLQIKRVSIGGASSETTVVDFTSPATDPETFVDQNLPRGSYQYNAVVTAVGRNLPEVSCRITLNRGEVAAFSSFSGAGNTTEPLPFAVTVANSQMVVVADLHTGDAQTFDLDLKPSGTIDGPFEEGLTTGLEFNSRDNSLYWLQARSGQHFMQKTDLTGAPDGNPVFLDTPFNLVRGASLAEIGYDSVRDQFWTVDLLNEVIYGFEADGSIPDLFRRNQIANPEAAGFLSGGIAVAASEGQSVVVDVPIGASTAGLPDAIARLAYDAGSLTRIEELFRIDLRSTIGLGDVGGVAAFSQGGEEFLYVVGKDTRAVYKLALGSPLPPSAAFRRGDANDDGRLNISDPSFILSFLFKEGRAPRCEDAADVNNSEEIEMADALFLFNYLFLTQAAPPPPFTACGRDGEANLPCAAATCLDL